MLKKDNKPQSCKTQTDKISRRPRLEASNWTYITLKDTYSHKAVSYDLKGGKLVILDISEFIDWDEYA